jgi:hypothetical protein
VAFADLATRPCGLALLLRSAIGQSASLDARQWAIEKENSRELCIEFDVIQFNNERAMMMLDVAKDELIKI